MSGQIVPVFVAVSQATCAVFVSNGVQSRRSARELTFDRGSSARQASKMASDTWSLCSISIDAPDMWTRAANDSSSHAILSG